MGIEDQKEEREVLESIFPDEITDISDTSYRISIALDVPPEPGEEDDDDPTPPTILLTVSYPEKYPDVSPNLDLSNPPNHHSHHPRLDLSSDKPHLLSSLTPIIEESLGMAMIFTLVTTLKDTAEQLIINRQKQAEEVIEVAARKAEEEENKKFFGTKVTTERFGEWRDKFRAEMVEREKRVKEEEEMEEKKKRSGTRSDEKKMTGREIWEKGLAGKEEVELEEGEDALVAVAKLSVKE